MLSARNFAFINVRSSAENYYKLVVIPLINLELLNSWNKIKQWILHTMHCSRIGLLDAFM